MRSSRSRPSTTARACRDHSRPLFRAPAQDVDRGGRLAGERLDDEARVADVDDQVEAVELAVRAALGWAFWIALVFPECCDVVPVARRVMAKRAAVVDADEGAALDACDLCGGRAVIVELHRARDL